MIALLLLLILGATGFDRTVDPDLTAIAAQRAVAIQVDWPNNWNHNGKPPGVAEVLAYNSGSLDPATTAMSQWRGSQSHWSVLSDPSYTRIGCASALAGDGVTTFFVCILAWPEAIEPLIAPGPPPVPRIDQIPPRLVLLPNTEQGASSATSGTVPPVRMPLPNLLLLAGVFMLGALVLLFIVRVRASQGMTTSM